MKNLEKTIEELQKQLDEVKQQLNKPTFEVGKWYKRDSGSIIFIQEFNSLIKGYDVDYVGEWRNEYISSGDKSEYRPATDKEVEEALIKEAEKRGFKEGVIFNSPNATHDFSFNQKLISSTFSLNYNMLEGESDKNTSSCIIFKDGKWANIIKDEPIKIGGYEVKPTVVNDKGQQVGKGTMIDGYYFSSNFWEAAKIISEHSKAKIMIGCSKQFDVSLETIEKILSL